MIPLTKNGYGFFEASSAMQKGIRRGDEKQAIYFAVEFFNSGNDEYVWKRLKIIASEDIGLAEPFLVPLINALYQNYSELKKAELSAKETSRPDRVYLIHAVLACCRAKKSRLVDWVMIAAWREHGTAKIEIPDYVYDKHTLKGKRMGRGADHFYNEASHLENHAVQPGEKEAKKNARAWVEKMPGKLSFTVNKKGTKSEQQTIFGEE